MSKALILAFCLIFFISTVSALTVLNLLSRSLLLKPTSHQMLLKMQPTTKSGPKPSTMLLKTRKATETEKMAKRMLLMLKPGTQDGGIWLRTETWPVLKTRRPSSTGLISEKMEKEKTGPKPRLLLDLFDSISSIT